MIARCHRLIRENGFCCSLCHIPDEDCRAMELKCIYQNYVSERKRCSTVHGFPRVVVDIGCERFRIVPLCDFHVANFEQKPESSSYNKVYKCDEETCLVKGMYEIRFHDENPTFLCLKHCVERFTQEYDMSDSFIRKERLPTINEFKIPNMNNPTALQSINDFFHLEATQVDSPELESDSFNETSMVPLECAQEEWNMFGLKDTYPKYPNLIWSRGKWGPPPDRHAVDYHVRVLMFDTRHKKRQKKFISLLSAWLQSGMVEEVHPALPRCCICRQSGVICNYRGNCHRNSSLLYLSLQPLLNEMIKTLTNFPQSLLYLVLDYTEWIPLLFSIDLDEIEHRITFFQICQPWDYDQFSINLWMCGDCIYQEAHDKHLLECMEDCKAKFTVHFNSNKNNTSPSL